MSDRVLVVCTAGIIDALGMAAENQARAQHGHPLAYADTDFFEIAAQVRAELMGELSSLDFPLPVSRRMPI